MPVYHCQLEALVNNDSREAEIQGVISEVPEIILRCVSRDEAALAVAQKVKYNKDITVGLIRSELLNLTEYNVHMAKLIDGGRNKAATEFSISLLQTLVIEEPKVISELHNLIDALAKLAIKPGYPESLQQLIEMIKNPAALSASNAGKEDKAKQLRDNKAPGLLVVNRVESAEPDSAGFRDQIVHNNEDKMEFSRILEAIKANFNDKYGEYRKSYA
ncbi:CCR4-NOT transcription complex subunit [Trifolium repens]|nr:CCR4-NOT transcription complex subunit [Trifolium repens]